MRIHHPIRFTRKEVQPILDRFMCIGLDVFPCGSWRRGLDTVGDLDIVVLGKVDGPELYHQTEAVDLYEGERVHLTYKLGNRGFKAEIIVTTPDRLGAALLRWTGNAKWNYYLRQKAIEKGFILRESGLYKHNECIVSKTEEEILEAIGEKWVTPEEREI